MTCLYKHEDMKARSFLLFFAPFAVILYASAVKKRKGAKILRKGRKE